MMATEIVQFIYSLLLQCISGFSIKYLSVLESAQAQDVRWAPRSQARPMAGPSLEQFVVWEVSSVRSLPEGQQPHSQQPPFPPMRTRVIYGFAVPATLKGIF